MKINSLNEKIKNIKKRILRNNSSYGRRFISGVDYFGKPIYGDIIHYFNENDEEIGQIHFPMTKNEIVYILEEKRKWDAKITKSYDKFFVRENISVK